ncbi:uncharacterized protein FFE2_08582 [Fusarium fujikuroi]|uniref:Uncharacterized protein n=1 Tax=Fusarium fujikuroi TaxID=5127 RepID=A0A9Q9UEY8_FUSFU|nr:uncharacterized protein FFE2_08582 [Fusarium fujikuroi]VTT74593.1 unnamed protein product [Fusarium fujikuroi]
MSSNNKDNDNDTVMDHGELPVRTSVNAQQGQAPAPGNAAPSGNNNNNSNNNNNGTPAVPTPVAGAAQNPLGTGSSFHGAMGFSPGLGGGGRGGGRGRGRGDARGGFRGVGRGAGRGSDSGRGGFTAPGGNVTFGVPGGVSSGSGAGGQGGLNSGATGAGGVAGGDAGGGSTGAGVFGAGFAGAGFAGAGAGASSGAGGFAGGSGAGFGAGFGRGGGGNQNSGDGYNSGRGGRGSSGSGWGNYSRGQGRGQGRGQYSRGRGQNNRGQITKRPTLKIVPHIRTGHLNDETGRQVGLWANNPTPGGGQQDGIAKYMPDGGMKAILKDGAEASLMLQRTQENTGSDRVLCLMQPLVNNANELARRRRLVRVIDHSDSPSLGLGHSAGLSGDKKKKEEKKPAVVEHVGDEQGSKCVLCGKTTHDINTCLNQPTGEVVACVLCHDKGHSLESCQQFLNMGDYTERVRLLVEGRASLPPLATDVAWWDVLWCWLEEDISKGHALPKGFPWTIDHAREVSHRARGRYAQELQLAFDNSGHDLTLLPPDRCTATIVDVYHKYWEVQGFPWPQRLVEMGVPAPKLDIGAPGFQPGAEGHQTVNDQRMEGAAQEEEDVLPDI